MANAKISALTSKATPVSGDTTVIVDSVGGLNKKITLGTLPVSTPTQTELDLKAPIASPTFTGTVSGITKSMVGLSNVDNTSDANKPVSTATQTALDLKQNVLTNPVTGTGASGQVSFWNGTNAQGGDNSLFWDAANKRLGVGVASPTVPLDVSGGNLRISFPDAVSGLGNNLTLGGKTGYSGTTFDLTGSSSTQINFFNNLRALNGSFIRATGVSTANFIELRHNEVVALLTSAGAGGIALQPSNGFVGIGTTAPTHALTMPASSSGLAIYNTADQTTNWERVTGSWSGNVFTLGTDHSGSGARRVFRIGTAGTNVSGINRTLNVNSAVPFFTYSWDSTGLAGYAVDIGGNQGLSASSGFQGALSITPTIIQTSTAGYRCLFVSPQLITTGSGAKILLDLGTNSAAAGGGTHTSNFSVDSFGNVSLSGKIFLTATNTAGGTTGAQTINRPSGTVNFAGGATSLVVTNAYVNTSSIVTAIVRTNDTTSIVKNVVCGTGSFTINLNAAATAETSVGFVVFN